jgi:hypothetical protein
MDLGELTDFESKSSRLAGDWQAFVKKYRQGGRRIAIRMLERAGSGQ